MGFEQHGLQQRFFSLFRLSGKLASDSSGRPAGQTFRRTARHLSVPLLALLVAACSPAVKQEEAITAPQTTEQANAQRERAAAMQQAAEERLAAEQAECYKKFFVSDCLRDAKARYTETILQARDIDIPARDFLRNVQRMEVERKEAERSANISVREAEQQAQADEYRRKEQERAAKREQRRADKAAQAATYRQKAAAEARERQARQAQRARRDAERKAKREQTERDAKTGKQ